MDRPVHIRMFRMLLRLALTLLFVSVVRPAHAQENRRVEIEFTPTARAQLAIWIESEDGSRFATVRLTESVARRGIGNRPGATQMNSGFRWPWGRREGVLPIWAHRRVDAGGQRFPRVIFNGRASEGNASSAGSIGEPGNTRDDYYCLSFQRERSGRDALDAVACASVFMSNKGRYVTGADVSTGYSEPYVDDGTPMMRALSLESLYPPRRDVTRCITTGCGDHDDVASYDDDVRARMPEIDAISMATPAADAAQRIIFAVPEDWPVGNYVAYLEINVEGDYNGTYNDSTFPTPMNPSGTWDYWALNYGYPYRGQPTLLFAVPFELRSNGGAWSVDAAEGYGALHGEDGDVRPIDSTIANDPSGAPGSGVDRLRASAGGDRVRVTVPRWDICNQPEPPPECGMHCVPDDGTCGTDLACGPDGTCVGLCDVAMEPGAVGALAVLPYEDEKHSHQWATFSFEVPASRRGISRYEVRVSHEPMSDLESFMRGSPAVEPSLETIELRVPIDGTPGELVTVEFGGLAPQSHYWVGVRAFDECNAPGPLAIGEVETTQINFTTVSPCFVATAAYGTPLAREIGVLRRFRDRHLRTNAPERALVRAYETVGPHLADVIREHDSLRAAVRYALGPIVALLAD
ncbi:MAG: CFI-box-CTERM domain-containing protein [Sandaracinaceae bacterium]